MANLLATQVHVERNPIKRAPRLVAEREHKSKVFHKIV